MIEYEKKIAQQTLNILKKKSWNALSLEQILKNVKVKDKSVINSAKCRAAIKASEKMIKNHGRMLVRKSGTEPKIRIMGESSNILLLKKCINIVKRSIN